MNPPNTCANLIKAINRVASPGQDALRLSRALAKQSARLGSQIQAHSKLAYALEQFATMPA